MRLTVLTDNNTYIDQYYLGEPAVSYYIEVDGKQILFDTGYSDVFLKNAAAMGIDFKKLDYLVLSHGHNDHTGGMESLLEVLDESPSEKKLIAHTDIFLERYADNLLVSSVVMEQKVAQYFTVSLSKGVQKLSERLYFLGEIPRRNDYEAKEAVGVHKIKGELYPDYVMDDSALVYKTSQGIYIITGCSHAGICNIIEYAKEITNESKVFGIIGGFHLFEENEQTIKTVEYLAKHQIPNLYPCHCTSLQVKAELMKCMQVQETGVGLVLEWL